MERVLQTPRKMAAYLHAPIRLSRTRSYFSRSRLMKFAPLASCWRSFFVEYNNHRTAILEDFELFEFGMLSFSRPAELDDAVAFTLSTTTDRLTQSRDLLALDILRLVFFAMGWPGTADDP